MPTATLSDAFVEAVGSGHRRYMDTHSAAPVGFCLVVYRSAEKSFALRYRDHQGAARQIVIGSPPGWSVAAARATAAALRVQIDGGRDPLAERHALRQRAQVLALDFIRDMQKRRERPARGRRKQHQQTEATAS